MPQDRPRNAQPIPNGRPADPSASALNRALDRRHSLDEQQRAIRDCVPRPHFMRPRPPG